MHPNSCPSSTRPRGIQTDVRAIWRGLAAAAIGVAGWAASAQATVISFDDGSVTAGSTLSNQYAASGVVFSPGGGNYSGVVNPPSTNVGFATNTDLTISAFDASVGEGSPLSGLVLRSNANFAAENGDPVFTLTFSAPVTALSLDFGDVKAAFQGSPAIFAVQPLSNVAVSIALAPSTKNGTSTAVGLPVGVTTIVVVPGTNKDFVAVDNLKFTLAPVPEPTTVAMSLLGFGVIGAAWHRRRQSPVTR